MALNSPPRKQLDSTSLILLRAASPMSNFVLGTFYSKNELFESYSRKVQGKDT